MKLKPSQSTKKGWSVSNTDFKITSSGFSLVEVILAISIFSLISSILIVAPMYGMSSQIAAGNSNRALFIAEEGLEAIRSLRNENFSNLLSGTYGIGVESGRWILVTSTDQTASFMRTITVTDVSPGIKQITSTVNWQWPEGKNNSVSLTTYITEWK